MGVLVQEARAARTILQHCLALPDESPYFIITDETTIDTATILAETGLDLGLQPTILYYSTAMQRKIQAGPLPLNFQTALADVTAALICLSNDPRSFLFREHMRQTAWNANLRVAHMPGINKSTLLLADLDYTDLNRQCELFALALAKGSHLEISTRGLQGQQYSLSIALDPWNRNPIISDGIIDPGVWGNVPSGETYLAPPEGFAEGEIAINGSIHTFLIPPGEELVLRFQQGRLVSWAPSSSSAAEYFQKTIVDFAAERGDPNWANLAEVGLGANPLIRALTGNPLLDEKKLGSVHIKLGDNIDMGGAVKSDIHCNLVCLSAEVRIDGKTILRDGQVALREADWREDYKDLLVPPHWSPDLSLRCTGVDAHIDERGHLKRFWHTSSGRVCSVPVGSERTSAQLAGIYQSLQRNGRHPISELARQPRALAEEELLQATYLLNLYGLVTPRDHTDSHPTL